MTAPDRRTGRKKTIDDIVKGLQTAATLMQAWSLTTSEHTRIQRQLDELQVEVDVHRSGCDRAMSPIEWHLEEAANYCRGKKMSMDEWEYVRDLWAGVGVTLAPCKPAELDEKEPIDDNFDRAMELLK